MQQSFLKPIASLHWEFKRPCTDGMRTSHPFNMLGDRWCLVISLNRDATGLPSTSECCVRLVSRTRRKRYDALSVYCNLIARGKLKTYYYRRTTLISVQTIFRTSFKNAEIYPKDEDEIWTVFCMFSGKNPLSLQVGNETIHLTTAGDNNVPSMDECGQVSSQVPENSLSSDISNLLEEELFPDFKLKCGDRVFPVHRCILAARSTVFRNMLLRQEGELGVADVDDLEVSVLELLLKWVYSGKLEAEDRADVLYEAAKKYGMRSLCTASSDYMIKNLSRQNCVRYLKVAFSHSDSKLQKAATSFIVAHRSVFYGTAFAKFLKNVTKSRKRGSSVKQEPSTSKTRRTQSSSDH